MTPTPHSSWIRAIAYRQGYLALFLHTTPPDAAPVALLYGPAVPSWMPGLLAAGMGGRKGVGAAYNRLLRGRGEGRGGYTYQRVEGRERVQELKEMMI